MAFVEIQEVGSLRNSVTVKKEAFGPLSPPPAGPDVKFEVQWTNGNKTSLMSALEAAGRLYKPDAEATWKAPLHQRSNSWRTEIEEGKGFNIKDLLAFKQEVAENSRKENAKEQMKADKGKFEDTYCDQLSKTLRDPGVVGSGGRRGRSLSDSLEMVGPFPKLREVALTHCSIDSEGALALAEGLHQGVEVLDLRFNNIGDEGVLVLVHSFPEHLQRLNLRANAVGVRGAQALAEKLPGGLKELDLMENSVGSEGAKALARALPAGLEVLNLEANGIGADGAQVLGRCLPRGLITLRLGSNRLGDDGVCALVQGLPGSLQRLGLASNQVGNRGACALAGAAPEGLLILELQENDIGDKGLSALLEGPADRLEKLDFASNRVEMVMVKGKAGQVRASAGLQSLDLSHNRIVDRNLEGLGKWAPESLQRLSLNGNCIGDEGARALVAGGTCQYGQVNLTDNMVSYAGVQSLRERVEEGGSLADVVKMVDREDSEAVSESSAWKRAVSEPSRGAASEPSMRSVSGMSRRSEESAKSKMQHRRTISNFLSKRHQKKASLAVSEVSSSTALGKSEYMDAVEDDRKSMTSSSMLVPTSSDYVFPVFETFEYRDHVPLYGPMSVNVSVASRSEWGVRTGRVRGRPWWMRLSRFDTPKHAWEVALTRRWESRGAEVKESKRMVEQRAAEDFSASLGPSPFPSIIITVTNRSPICVEFVPMIQAPTPEVVEVGDTEATACNVLVHTHSFLAEGPDMAQLRKVPASSFERHVMVQEWKRIQSLQVFKKKSNFRQTRLFHSLPPKLSPSGHKLVQLETSINKKSPHNIVFLYRDDMEQQPASVLFFQPGYLLPDKGYHEFAATVAMHGIVVVIPQVVNTLLSGSRHNGVEVLKKTVEWTVQNWGLWFRNTVATVFMGGHSRGGKEAIVATSRLLSTAAVMPKKLILLDPVDVSLQALQSYQPIIDGHRLDFPSGFPILLIESELGRRSKAPPIPPSIPQNWNGSQFLSYFTAAGLRMRLVSIVKSGDQLTFSTRCVPLVKEHSALKMVQDMYESFSACAGKFYCNESERLLCSHNSFFIGAVSSAVLLGILEIARTEVPLAPPPKTESRQ